MTDQSENIIPEMPLSLVWINRTLILTAGVSLVGAAGLLFVGLTSDNFMDAIFYPLIAVMAFAFIFLPAGGLVLAIKIRNRGLSILTLMLAVVITIFGAYGWIQEFIQSNTEPMLIPGLAGVILALTALFYLFQPENLAYLRVQALDQ